MPFPARVPLLEVVTAGLLTSVQERAMDPFAASVANLLVGNPRLTPTLEITLLGPTLRVLAPVRIALCGGDLSARLDGEPLPLWKTGTARPDQKISFGRRRSGARVFLTVSGGLKVDGLERRSVRPGEILFGRDLELPDGVRGLPVGDHLAYELPAILRVLPGPHPSHFTEQGHRAFFSDSYTLSPQSSRQGYRLNGPSVTRTGSVDILSEPMPLGGVQIPPDGQPILLMADRQSTGGYPLVGVVISADIPRAGQLAPGDAVRFVPVSFADAVNEAIRAERRLRLLELATGSGGQTPSVGR